MIQNKQEIFNLIEQVVNEQGFLLIEVQVRGDSRNRVVEVFIDNEKGVSTKNCADVSWEIGEAIESRELIDSKYRLEVSSPGTSRPLKFLLQYPKHVGRNFDIKYDKNGATARVKGKLEKVEGDSLYIVTSDSELVIKFENIIKAKVLISF